MIKAVVLWVLCYLAILNSTFSQSSPSITYLGIEQGLSNNAVTCIYQDHNGFMWFGTYDGLNRYDGNNFVVYRNECDDTGSLVNNRIACLTEDQQHRLWIGTRDGVSIYNNVTGSFSRLYFISGKIKEKLSVPITALKVLDNGSILIGTLGEGLFICNGTEYAKKVPLITGNTRFQVEAITVDAANRTWIFIRNVGLCRYDDRSGRVYVVNNSIRNGISLCADSGDDLWLGTDSGIYKYNFTSNTYSEILSTHTGGVMRLIIDRQHTLWAATIGEGVFYMPITTGKINKLVYPWNKELIICPTTLSILEDHEGRKWIGTLQGGINILDPKRTRFSSLVHDPLNTNSLIYDFALSLCEDANHNIWIGTDGGGLSIWNRQHGRFSNFKHLSGDNNAPNGDAVTSIICDAQQTMWVATWGRGIYRYNKSSTSFQHYVCMNPFTGGEDKDAWVLYEDGEKKLWAGTFMGPLYQLNRKADRFEVFDSTLMSVLSMAEDSKGNLWAGRHSTLVKVDRVGKKHRLFNIGYPVRAIHEDRAGNFWIGTEGGGLLLFNRENGRLRKFTKVDGLTNNSVIRILEDTHGHLWLSTFSGISKFDPIKKTFRNFSHSDGLLSNQFSYHAALALSSGELMFGGIKGLNIFHPDSLTYLFNMPQVQLTGLRIDNVPVERCAQYVTERTQNNVTALKVPYSKAAIAFDFVAPEYSAPDRISYAYYMEGWDKGWNYAGKARTANYTRLNEGSYALHIKNTNAAGEWNKSEYILKIEVLPPWYRTWWAYLVYLSILLYLIYLYQRYKAQQIKLNFEVRLARLEAEKEKELNEKKFRFFTNVSHEFRTSLTLIINPIKEMLKTSDKTTGGQLDVTYRNARRLLSLADQLLVFRRTESETDKLRIICVNLHDLCQEVFHCFSQQAEVKHIDYAFSSANKQLEIYADREKIEIVLFNLLSNAMKFTPDKGKVSLSVAESEQEVTITVTDTGCGVSESPGQLFEKFNRMENVKAGFGIGLYLSKQLVESHMGQISFTSVPEQGTIFTVILKKGIEHFAGQYIFEGVGESSTLIEELMGDITAGIPVEKEQDPVGDIVSDKPVLLLVDDNPEICNYLRQLFHDRFTVYEADNGDDGLQLAKEQIPDIIISDVIMKGLSGVELCHAIRHDSSLSHIPVVLLTADPSQEAKLRSIECGANDYIAKPFEKELLIARIDNLLQSRDALQRYFFDKITLRENNLRVSAEDKDFLERCISIVESNLNNDVFNIKMLATEIGMSHSTLYRKVKAVSGSSVNAFIRYIRLRRAAVLMLSTGCNVNQAAFGVGINDVKYFRVQFSRLFGMIPSAYIKKYRNTFNKEFNVITWNE